MKSNHLRVVCCRGSEQAEYMMKIICLRQRPMHIRSQAEYMMKIICLRQRPMHVRFQLVTEKVAWWNIEVQFGWGWIASHY